MLSKKTQTLLRPMRLPPLHSLMAVPLFTTLSVVLVYLIWNVDQAAVLHYQWLLYVGVGMILVSGICALRGWMHFVYRYDLFLTGGLLVWLISWQDYYELSTPVFRSFPIFFAMFSQLLTLTVIHQREHFFGDQVTLMRIINGLDCFQPKWLAAAVLVSLMLLPQHYLTYLTTVAFLLIQMAFAVCLGPQKQAR